jgi:hypothetical protein
MFTQQPALLVILNIPTSFQPLDQNFACTSHFLKQAVCHSRLSCLSRRYKYRLRRWVIILTSNNPYTITATQAQATKTEGQIWGRQIMSCVVDVRTVVHFAKPASENKLTLVLCVCVCVCVCVCARARAVCGDNWVANSS